MAQPQGLNIPSILTTGIVGTILTMTVVEGVRAYYNQYVHLEEARKWEIIPARTSGVLKEEQQKLLKFETSIPIDQAMQTIARTGGKLPATQPTK